MFGIKNTETPKRKEELAKKYVDKVSDHQYFQNAIEESINETKQGLNEVVSIFKKEKEINKIESKTKQDIESFLLDNGLLSDFKKIFSSIILISEEGKDKISEAKNIIHSSQTEQEAVSKINEQLINLGIEQIPQETENKQLTKNNINQSSEQETTSFSEYDGKQKLLMIDKVKENKQEFGQKTIQISNNLGINPNRLMWIMNKESKLDHKAKNKASGATGLIQFMPNTAKGLGTDTRKLKNMSNIQQLDYVEKYFQPYKNKIKTYTDLYLATFYPVAIGKPDNFVIGSEVSDRRARLIGKQNNMNDGNPITVAHVNSRISQGIPTEYLRDNNSNNILKFKYNETMLVGDSHVGGLKMGGYPGETRHFDGNDTGQIYDKLVQGKIDLSGKKKMILYTGSNDITKNKINQIEGNLKKIKDLLDQKNIYLVLSKIPYNKSKEKQQTDKVNTILEKFAQENQLSILDLNSNINIANNEYASDGVHLNSQGYRKINRQIDTHMAA